MAEYDGSIRIGTGIDTQGFEEDGKKLEAKARRLAEIISDSSDVKIKVDASEAKKEIKDAFDDLEKEEKRIDEIVKRAIERARGQQDEISAPETPREGAPLTTAGYNQDAIRAIEAQAEKIDNIDEHWNQLRIDVEEYAKSLKELQNQGKFFGDEDYDRLYLYWKNATDAVKAYQAELDKQTDSGQAKIAEQEAKTAEKREAAQRRAEEQAKRALQRENERIQRQAENEAKLAAKEAERQAKIQAEAAEEQRLDQIRVNATVSNQEIIDLLERRRQLISEIKDMEAAGVGLGFQKYEDANRELEGINGKIKDYRKNLGSVPEKFEKMRKSANKAFNAVTSGTRKSSGLLSAFSNRLKGIALSLLIFNWVSKGFNVMISGMKKGFENFMGYSESYAQGVQNMKNAMSTLGNQFAAAFAPIAQMVIPWLTSLVSALSNAVSNVAQFIAILGGKSTFIRAKKVQDDYNKTLGGTAKAADKARGALAKFDDLDVLEKPSDAYGDGSLLGNAGADMFEEVPVDKEFSKLAEMVEGLLDQIKKIIQDFAIGDFFQAGKDTSALVAGIFDFFSDAIDKVNWYKIGQNVGDFFAGIDWVKILKSAGKLIWKSLKAVLKVWKGAFDAAPIETGIATAIGILKFTKVGSILKAVLLPRINDALGKVSEGLDLKGVALGIAAVFGEFTLVSDAFEGLTSGAQGVASALGEIIIGAGLAVGALKLIGLSNPFTAVIVGITGVAGALKGMADAKQEALEKFDEMQEISVFGERVSDLTTRWDENTQAIRDRIAASQEYVQSAGIAETKMLQDLSDRYFDLYEKEDLSNQEMEEMQRLSDLLVEKYPELDQYYNDQTGLIDTTRQKVDELIDSKLREIKLNAVEEQLTEAYKQREDAMKAIGEAANVMSKAQDDIQQKQENYDDLVSRRYAAIAYEDISKLLGIGVEKLDKAAVSQELLDNLVKAGAEDTEDLVELQQQLYDIVTKHGEEEFRFAPGFHEDIDEAALALELLKEDYDETLNSFLEKDKLVAEADSNIAYLTSLLSDGMRNTGSSAVEGFDSAILDSVNDIKERGKDISDWFLDSAESKDGFDINSPSKKTEKIAMFAVEGLNKGIENNIPSTKKMVLNYITQVVDKFSELIPLLMDVGKNAMSSLLDGIISMENRLYQKLNEIIRNISSSISNATSGGTFNSGISTYGLRELSSVSNEIPRLATGAVIRGGNPFMAILGDQPAGKTNIEAPLDTIRQAVREELSGINLGNAGIGQTRVVLNINGIDVGEAMLDDLFSVMSRRGYDVSVLGVT